MLTAVGVGEAIALPGAAAISWVLKDGLGALGMMLVASKFGTRFDTDTKKTKWRADILHNVGVGLELITPLAPYYFLFLASFANVCKGLAGITSGATRAHLNKHFSKNENLGDITAKSQTQGVAVWLGGMSIGILLSMLPIHSPGSIYIFATFSILAIGHIFSSYKALSSVALNTLNEQRLSLLIDHFISNFSLPNPFVLKDKETIITTPLLLKYNKIQIGSSIEQSIKNTESLVHLFNIFKNEKYIISYNSSTSSIYILLKKDTEIVDIIKAYLNAFYFKSLLPQINRNENEIPINPQYEHSLQWANKNFNLFWKELETKQWNTSHLLLLIDDNRVNWS